jgi:small GTP-binding protein
MARGKKLCLVGDFSVGKTSLIRRYIQDDFSLDYHATVGVQVHEHEDQIDTGTGLAPFPQLIWDIEGSKSGPELVTNYILGAAGALVVGDATRSDVVPSMISHARHFLDILPGRPIVFAMNKCDLLDVDERPSGEELTETFGSELLHTSALTGESVKTLFQRLCERVVEIGA